MELLNVQAADTVLLHVYQFPARIRDTVRSQVARIKEGATALLGEQLRMTLADGIQKYLDWCKYEKEFSKDTISNYTGALKLFGDFMGDRDLATIVESDILAYKMHLHDRQLKQISRQTYISAVKNFLHYCHRKEIETLFFDKVELPKRGDYQKAFLSDAEVKQLIDGIPAEGASNLRDRAIIAVLFTSGMRASELISLQIDQVDLEAGETRVIGKGSKLRLVFIAEWALEHLRRYLYIRADTDPRLFVGHLRHTAGGVPGTQGPGGWVDVISGFGREALHQAVSKRGKAVLKKTIGPHTLRHSFATDWLLRGGDLRALQLLMGHSRLGTTENYTHLVNAQLREQYDRIKNTTNEFKFSRHINSKLAMEVHIRFIGDGGLTIDEKKATMMIDQVVKTMVKDIDN